MGNIHMAEFYFHQGNILTLNYGFWVLVTTLFFWRFFFFFWQRVQNSAEKNKTNGHVAIFCVSHNVNKNQKQQLIDTNGLFLCAIVSNSVNLGDMFLYHSIA